MSDTSDGPTKKTVSLRKQTPAPSDEGGAPARPRTVTAAFVALVAAGALATIAALSLFGLRGWLTYNVDKSDRDATPPLVRTPAELYSRVSSIQQSQVIASLILALAIGLVAFGVYRGRHWSRWGVIGLWVICTYTGTLAGLASVLSIAASVPLVFKAAAFLSGVAFIAAVVLVNLRPSTAYFARNRPVRPDAGGRASGRLFGGGLFGSRASAPARPGSNTQPGGRSQRRGGLLTSSAATRGQEHVERTRSKTRANTNAEAIAKGAELARSRAKASKSRRSDG